MVRGAPAIAIAAALSLAVEVFNGDFSGTAKDAASFLIKKLEYLVTRYYFEVQRNPTIGKLIVYWKIMHFSSSSHHMLHLS